MKISDDIGGREATRRFKLYRLGRQISGSSSIKGREKQNGVRLTANRFSYGPFASQYCGMRPGTNCRYKDAMLPCLHRPSLGRHLPCRGTMQTFASNTDNDNDVGAV